MAILYELFLTYVQYKQCTILPKRNQNYTIKRASFTRKRKHFSRKTSGNVCRRFVSLVMFCLHFSIALYGSFVSQYLNRKLFQSSHKRRLDNIQRYASYRCIQNVIRTSTLELNSQNPVNIFVEAPPSWVLNTPLYFLLIRKSIK